MDLKQFFSTLLLPLIFISAFSLAVFAYVSNYHEASMCFDSDGTKNFATFGFVTGHHLNNSFYTHTDSCMSSTVVSDWSCIQRANGRLFAVEYSRPCAPGGVCVTGYCVPQKRVFVTNSTYSGSFGGYHGGVGICQQAATTAGLGGEWTPWLSVNGTNGTASLQASQMIPDAQYLRLDGAVIATGKTDLINGGISNSININEYGQDVQLTPNGTVSAQQVWTGSSYFGGFSTGHDCAGWTSLFPATATVGNTGATTGRWTDDFVTPCYNNLRNRLYCFEK